MTKEKYSATLEGCARGDTLGMPVEGWKRGRIQKVFGKIREPIDAVILYDGKGNEITQDEFGELKNWSRGQKKGEYTDDTILTLALARSIVAKKGIDIRDIARRQLHEYKIRLQPDGTVKGGFGKTTMDAFKRLDKGVSPYESGVIGGPGNAPPMKMPSVGLFMARSNAYEQGLRDAEDIGRITHLDPRSIVSGVVQAHAVYALITGCSREVFVDSLMDVAKRWERPVSNEYPLADKGSLTSRLEWIKEKRDVDPDTAHRRLQSSSDVISSYPFALFMFQRYWDDPLVGMVQTVNYGGDCDTTAAMFSALGGARHGPFWPNDWPLQDCEEIRTLGRKLYDLFE